MCVACDNDQQADVLDLAVEYAQKTSMVIRALQARGKTFALYRYSRELDTQDYQFFVGFVVTQPTFDKFELRFTLRRNGRSALYNDHGRPGYQDFMFELADMLGGCLENVDWPGGSFSVVIDVGFSFAVVAA